MKIPESSANIGAYYGNEENGQWQPNGVIIDGGVGGGVVGSGDAGIHRPPVYPVHVPRGHMPGYVMAGAYYPPTAYPPVPAPAQDDFADYMWMENEEEFDKQVMQQLEEEALMEQCIEAMLEDEQRERHNRPTSNGHNHHYPTTSNGTSMSLEEAVSRSTLNPLAAEFVPTRSRTTTTDERQESTEVPATEESQKTEDPAPTETASSDKVEEVVTNTEEPLPPQKDPPEVSAADVQPIDKTHRPPTKEQKKDISKTKISEVKKTPKAEIKVKAKTLPAKSETKVQPKKKDVKIVKSETKAEDKVEESLPEVTKPQSTPVEEIQAPSGFKPINYAAAAKANKPKKIIAPSSPPTTVTEKQIQPQLTKADKIKNDKKDKINLQRKNSAK